MDIVFLRRLRLDVLIGVHAFERKGPQPLYLDVELFTDVRVAAAGDRIESAVDYAAVAEALADYAAGTDFELVERFAEGCAALLLERFPVAGVRLAVHKPWALGNAESAGVVIERRREAS